MTSPYWCPPSSLCLSSSEIIFCMQKVITLISLWWPNTVAIHVSWSEAVGALVCMSRRDVPVCPGDVIICRRSCAEPGSGLFVPQFLPHDVTFTINWWCQVPLAEAIGACIRQDRLAEMHSDPDRDFFLLSRDIVLLSAKSEYLQIHIYVFTTRIVARLTATTAILSRMCRQVWIGTFGICRSHARAPIPMQTNTLGTSRCTDRYIRHMQTSAPND